MQVSSNIDPTKPDQAISVNRIDLMTHCLLELSDVFQCRQRRIRRGFEAAQFSIEITHDRLSLVFCGADGEWSPSPFDAIGALVAAMGHVAIDPTKTRELATAFAQQSLAADSSASRITAALALCELDSDVPANLAARSDDWLWMAAVLRQRATEAESFIIDLGSETFASPATVELSERFDGVLVAPYPHPADEADALAEEFGIPIAEAVIALDAARLDELNNLIDNWNGTDNDPIFDALVRERRVLFDKYLLGDGPVPLAVAGLFIQIASVDQVLELEQHHPGIINLAGLNSIILEHDTNGLPLDQDIERLRAIRDAMVADLAGAETADGLDVDVAAIAHANGISYEQAEGAVTAHEIDRLTTLAQNLPSLEGAASVLADRDRLVADLAGGDEQLAQLVIEYLSSGSTTQHAWTSAVDDITTAEALVATMQIRSLLKIDDQSGWTPWHDGDAEFTPEEAVQAAEIINGLDPFTAGLVLDQLSEEDLHLIQNGLEGNATHADKPWGHWAWTPLQVPVRETRTWVGEVGMAAAESYTGFAEGFAAMSSQQGGPSEYNQFTAAGVEQRFENSAQIVLDGSIPFVSNGARCLTGEGWSCVGLGVEVVLIPISEVGGHFIGAAVIGVVGRIGVVTLVRVRLRNGTERVVSMIEQRIRRVPQVIDGPDGQILMFDPNVGRTGQQVLFDVGPPDRVVVREGVPDNPNQPSLFDDALPGGQPVQTTLFPDIDSATPTPVVTRVGDNQVLTIRGVNARTITFDPITGRPVTEAGVIRADYGSSPRGDNATVIGRTGNPGDHGGHLGAHRFYGDTPDEGIVPQAGNLNLSAWSKMENEWADWASLGMEVRYTTNVFPPGATRPDQFRVSYTVRDPGTGEVVYERFPRFRNEAGQPFERVYLDEMQATITELVND